jgi:RNA polymerase sigma-70 factor (ECF subfamily)
MNEADFTEETMGHGATMSREEEGRLIQACQQGDRESLRLLYETYQRKVYSIALYFFHGDEATAEDVTQEVFLRLFTRLDQFRKESGFNTWLYRLVSNACIDEMRKRKRWVPMAELNEVEDEIAPALGIETFFRYERSEAIQAALAELKPELRLTLLLRYFEDLSYEEMAVILGCSKGTVASRLNRSHKLLARKLAPLRETFFSGDR